MPVKILSPIDYKAARKIIRWVGIGVLPKQSDAELLLEIVKSFDTDQTSSIREVAEQINHRHLASQETCKIAEIQLNLL